MRYETKGKRNIDLGYNIPENKTLKITDNNGENPQFMVLGGRKIHLTSGLPEYIDVELVDNQVSEPSEAMMNVAKAFDLSGLGEELTSVIKKQRAIKQAFSEILFFKSEIDQKLAEYELLINGQVEDIRNEQEQNKSDTNGAILTLSNGQNVNTKDIQNIYGLIGGLNQKSLEIDSSIRDIETILKNHEHGITKESLGLGKVDNTPDMDKPVSKATQEALDSKVSVDEFNEVAEQLKKIQKKQRDFQRGIDSLGGIGIGTANLEGGREGQVLVKKSDQNGDFEWSDSAGEIDDALSLTSEYPVQNKVITSSIIIKSNTIPTASQALVGSEYQYMGETNQTYTHGYIYECVQEPSLNQSSSYVWERVDIQPPSVQNALKIITLGD